MGGSSRKLERHSPGPVIALTAALFCLILGLRIVAGTGSANAVLVLMVLPIALCAYEFGLRGGIAGGLAAALLLVSLKVAPQHELGDLGFFILGFAYFLVGGVFGRFVDRTRELETRVERHYEVSLDLFCTATPEGYFEELNPAWERALGYTAEALRSRPFVEFVHPDDRERTAAEAARLADTGETTVSFRNRYRRVDGEYVWLEWSACADLGEDRIYASARDITVQKQAERALENQNELLERTVRERTQALEEARLETLQRLALAAEYRDDDTHQHTQRVGRTAALLARRLGLSEDSAAVIRQAAPLHDVGKVGIPDGILLKPGRLSEEEFELMKEHAEIGARLLSEGSFAVLRLAREIALTHHERWDGAGYPRGIGDEEIPLAGRITAVADVFDALTHDRPYKSAWPVEEAVAEIERHTTAQFDPQVVEAFSALEHSSLMANVEEYDLELPPPPLTAPGDGNGLSQISEPAMHTKGRGRFTPTPAA